MSYHRNQSNFAKTSEISKIMYSEEEYLLENYKLRAQKNTYGTISHILIANMPYEKLPSDDESHSGSETEPQSESKSEGSVKEIKKDKKYLQLEKLNKAWSLSSIMVCNVYSSFFKQKYFTHFVLYVQMKGEYFFLYGKTDLGSPHRCMIKIDVSGKEISWGYGKMTLENVIVSISTKMLEKYDKSLNPGHCFSIIGENCTLDLRAVNVGHRNVWNAGLYLLTEKTSACVLFRKLRTKLLAEQLNRNSEEIDQNRNHNFASEKDQKNL